MGQEALRQKLSQRLSKDAQGVIRTLKSAGVKLSSAEEAGISRGSLDQFSDVQLGERFNSKVLGMLGISGTESPTYYGQGRSGTSQEGAQKGKTGSQKSDIYNKKRRSE